MHFFFSDFADKYYQLKKMNKREIGSSIFRMFSPRRYLSRMRSILLIIFTATSPCVACGPHPTSAVVSWRKFFLGLSCFGSGGAGSALPGRSALATVPELHVSSFRHATWLNFADFCSSGDFFAYRTLLSILVVAVNCLEVLGNNSCNPFYRWLSWGRTIVYPDAFVLHSKISSRSVFDDVWWPIFIYRNTRQLYISIISNLQIKLNKNLSKNWILSILQSLK